MILGLLQHNQQLENKVKELEAQLKEADSVIGFYADKDSWEPFTEAYSEYAEDHMICADDCIQEDDTEIFKDRPFNSVNFQVGGKRAREYQAKYGEGK